MNLAESLRTLSNKLDNLEATNRSNINESVASVLKEGGNVFKGTDGKALTQRINKVDVPATIKWLEKITGLDLSGDIDPVTGYPSRWLGSTGKKVDSGDLDLGVDIKEATKQQLADRLSKWATENNLDPKDYVRSKGEVHFKTPIIGDPKNGFVQTDFMFFSDIDWGVFYYAGTFDTNYKGVYRNILMSSIAKPLGLKIGTNGVISRASNTVVTTDPDQAAEILLGKGKTKNDLINVETIYKNLENDPDRKAKLKDFEELLAKDGLQPPANDKLSEAKSDNTDWFKSLKDKIAALNEATEASPRIPHPEDAIFTSQAEAAKYEQALEDAIINADKISIKWDGGIALFFGTSPEGKFFINDKYMPEGFYAYSPQDWERYDTTIKKSKTARPDLYKKLAVIWKGLHQDVTDNATYKGDLMDVSSGKPIQPVDGNYQFKPTTVTYNIPVDSSLGKLIQNKVGVMVVHQRNGAPWDGKTGLENRGNVAIIPPKAGVEFKLKNPGRLATDARTAVQKEGPVAEQFLNGMASTARAAIQKYFNHKITKQTSEDLLLWLEKNVSGKQYTLLTAYIKANPKGIKALEKVWNSVYKLKENLVSQLEQQVSGFAQSTDGQPGGEGFVVPTKAGLIKLVNRGQFGAAHFNK